MATLTTTYRYHQPIKLGGGPAYTFLYGTDAWQTGSGTTLTIPVTVPASASMVVCVTICGAANTVVSSATLNGYAMTQDVTSGGDYNSNQSFIHSLSTASPGTGSYNLVLNLGITFAAAYFRVYSLTNTTSLRSSFGSYASSMTGDGATFNGSMSPNPAAGQVMFAAGSLAGTSTTTMTFDSSTQNPSPNDYIGTTNFTHSCISEWTLASSGAFTLAFGTWTGGANVVSCAASYG
jgi:hypothetical protein